MAEVVLLKNGERCAEPSKYAERQVPLDVYRGVLQILAEPDVAAIGSLEYNILDQMIKAGLADNRDAARWDFFQIAGWLNEQGLLVVSLRYVGTAGASSHFYKLADGVEVKQKDS